MRPVLDDGEIGVVLVDRDGEPFRNLEVLGDLELVAVGVLGQFAAGLLGLGLEGGEFVVGGAEGGRVRLVVCAELLGDEGVIGRRVGSRSAPVSAALVGRRALSSIARRSIRGGVCGCLYLRGSPQRVRIAGPLFWDPRKSPTA